MTTLNINTAASSSASPTVNPLEWGVVKEDGGVVRLRFNLKTDPKNNKGGGKLATGSLGRLCKHVKDASNQDVFLNAKLLPLALDANRQVMFDEDGDVILDSLDRQACLEYWKSGTSPELAPWVAQWQAAQTTAAANGWSTAQAIAAFQMLCPACPPELVAKLAQGASGQWVRLDIHQWVARNILNMDPADFNLPISFNCNFQSEKNGSYNKLRNAIESGAVSGRFCLELYLNRDALRVAKLKDHVGATSVGTYDKVINPVTGMPLQFMHFDWTWALQGWKISYDRCPWGGGEALDSKVWVNLDTCEYGKARKANEEEEKIQSLLATWSGNKGARWISKPSVGLWPADGQSTCLFRQLSPAERDIWVKALHRVGPEHKGIQLKGEFAGLSWSQVVQKIVNPELLIQGERVAAPVLTSGVQEVTVAPEPTEHPIVNLNDFVVTLETTEETAFYAEDEIEMGTGVEVDEDEFDTFAAFRS